MFKVSRKPPTLARKISLEDNRGRSEKHRFAPYTKHTEGAVRRRAEAGNEPMTVDYYVGTQQIPATDHGSEVQRRLARPDTYEQTPGKIEATLREKLPEAEWPDHRTKHEKKYGTPKYRNNNNGTISSHESEINRRRQIAVASFQNNEAPSATNYRV
jgi:hypothetical protein